MQPMTWASPDDKYFSSDYGLYEIKREGEWFYLTVFPHGSLGRFRALDAAKSAAEVHAVLYAGAEDAFTRLVTHLHGEAPF